MTRGRLGRWARRASGLTVAAVIVLLAAPPAWSHSELERSDPANGGMVAQGRTTLRLWFEEPVAPRTSTFELSGSDGRRVSTQASVSRDGLAVGLETDPLPVGTYRIAWRTLSLSDGHSSNGSFVFGAGLRPDVVPDAEAGLPPIGLLVLRWVDLAALLLVIGALAVSGRVLGALGEAGRRPRERARTIAVVAVLVAAYAGLVTPFVRTHVRGVPLDAWIQETWATLVSTSWGHLWLAKEGLTLLAAVMVWSWGRGQRKSVALARLALASLVGAAVLEALAGHASSLPRLPVVTALVSAAHVVAAGVWAGGLGVLVLCLVPLMRHHPDLRGVVLSSVWRTFSPMAALATVVLLATGLYEAGRQVPDLSSLTSTVYGGGVAAKTLLLVLALALAGLNVAMVDPRVAAHLAHRLGRDPGWLPLSRQRFTTTVTIEAIVLFAAVGLAAVLTTSPTAREALDARQVTSPHTATVDGVFITFEGVPAGAGRSRLVARVRATVLPPPAPVEGVDVVLSGPAGPARTVPLIQVEDGRFEGDTATTEGRWSATIRVHRRGLVDTVTRADLAVAPPDGAEPSRLEVAGTALSTTLLLGLACALTLVRRRPDRRTPTLAAPEPDRETSLR